jgi:hypothetical protein
MKTIETLGQVAAREIIQTNPIKALLEKHGPDQAVITWRKVTPFGTFLTGITVIEDGAA